MANRSRAIAGLAAILISGSPALASDASRISYLESQVQALRAQLDEQNRKIQRLEEQLARLSGRPAGTAPQQRRTAEATAPPAAAQGAQPWHQREAWTRVAKGMTEDEVRQVLGVPSSGESVDEFKTLFYRGTNASGTSLSGMVNLREGKVVAIVPPDK